MDRRIFLKNTALAGVGTIAAPHIINAANNSFTDPLTGKRFVTECIMIRTSPWEVSRDVKLHPRDEHDAHTLKVVRALREAFAKNNPDGRLTWGFTLNALEDKRKNYQDIRNYVVECYQKYGDEISYFPVIFLQCICHVKGSTVK